MPMDLKVGDVVELKKQHPCGNKSFKILRTGADFRIQCLGCERQVWVDRPNLEKRIKKIFTEEK